MNSFFIMNEYQQRAAEEILKDLNFNDFQIDLIGRVLSMEKDDELVKCVEIKSYGDYYSDAFGPIMCLNKNRKACVRRNFLGQDLTKFK